METDAGAIWKQEVVPVIYRQGDGQPLMVKLPYSPDNSVWMRDGNRRKPKWNKKFTCWETPNAWFKNLIQRALHKFGRIYVIQPHNVLEKCAPACWNANGFECNCSCLGKNHGSGQGARRWWVVSEACALQWQGRQLACQLIERPSFPNR